MRNLKRTILAAALLISFSTAGAALGNDVSAASLQAAEPAVPYPTQAGTTASP